jgi:hypothetical protein
MVDLKPEIEKVLDKRKADFELSEEIAERLEGEEGLERVRDLRKQFWLVRTYLVENKDSIEGDEADELRELVANKLAVGSKAASIDDWWWTQPSPSVERLLREVHRVLEKGTAKKKWLWLSVLRYTWKIFLEVVYVVVVLAVFSIATTKFETVVIAILVLIYNRAKGIGTGIGISFSYLAAVMERMYGDIGRSMKLKIPILPEKEPTKE